MANQLRASTTRADRIEFGLESTESASEALADLIQSGEESAIGAVVTCIDAEDRLGNRIKMSGGDPKDGGCIPDSEMSSPDMAQLILGTGPVDEAEVLRPYLVGCAADSTLVALFGRQTLDELTQKLAVRFNLSAPTEASPECTQRAVITRLGILRVDELAIQQGDFLNLSTANGLVLDAERDRVLEAMVSCGELDEAVLSALLAVEPETAACAVAKLSESQVTALGEKLVINAVSLGAVRFTGVPLGLALTECTAADLDIVLGPTPALDPFDVEIIEAFLVEQTKIGAVYGSQYDRACARRVFHLRLDAASAGFALEDPAGDPDALERIQNEIRPVLEEATIRCNKIEDRLERLVRDAGINATGTGPCLAEETPVGAVDLLQSSAAREAASPQDYEGAVDAVVAALETCATERDSLWFKEVYSGQVD